jgi:hypothetical protein
VIFCDTFVFAITWGNGVTAVCVLSCCDGVQRYDLTHVHWFCLEMRDNEYMKMAVIIPTLNMIQGFFIHTILII